MLIKTQGIALHNIQYGDASLIVKMLTRELSVLTFMIKGARQKKSGKPRGYFSPMQHLYIEFNYRANKNFQILKEIRVDPSFTLMHAHPYKSAVLMFCAEFLYKIFDKPDTCKDAYNVSIHFLKQLKSAKNVANFPLLFVLAVLKQLGYSPQNNFSEHCPVFSLENGFFVEPGSNTVQHLCAPDVSASLSQILTAADVVLPLAQRQLLMNELLNYTAYQTDKPIQIKSVAILHSILND